MVMVLQRQCADETGSPNLPKVRLSDGDWFSRSGPIFQIRSDAAKNCSKGQAHHDEDTKGQRAQSGTQDGETSANTIAAHGDDSEDHGD